MEFRAATGLRHNRGHLPLPLTDRIQDNALVPQILPQGEEARIAPRATAVMNQSGTSYESSLLLTLGEITQLAVHSRDSAETLTNIVRLIQGRFHTAVCSVYVLEPDRGELVLGATVGLKPDAVGRVRMPLGEGLTGLVGEHLAPVMVADAFHHPRFKYFPEAGEDPYHSFLGVPLLEGGTLQGVLVVQTVEPRTFSQSEERMLVSIAAQLAPLVADAKLLERVSAVAHLTPQQAEAACPEIPILQGSPLSPGLGLGQAYIVDGFDEWRRTIAMKARDPERERRRLAVAVERAREEVSHLSQHISELVGENHGAILNAQLLIMQDRTIERDLEASLAAGASAEGALFATLDQYVTAFQRVSTPFFKERVFDIKDVFHRILWQLRPRPDKGQEGGDRVVLIAREASVMELFAVDVDQLAGVVVEHGGAQSHAAILARSLGIPMVGQVENFSDLLHPGRRLLVDGGKGIVTLDPPADTVAPLQSVFNRESASGEGQATEATPGLPRVEVNINLLYEARFAVKQGVGGVGLYRSEFLFLARRSLPSEDEQVTIYRKLLGMMEGRPVCVRTFDLRPDKLASYSHLGPAATRPYDWRLVLESPPLQQLFLDQVRAILRAATAGQVRMLIPLVTRSEVLDLVLRTLTRAKEDLTRQGLDFVATVPIGAMIEVAAAVPMMAAWGELIDFFALGTNDLTASALGLDRDDPIASGQSDSLHPGVLHLINTAVTEAHRARRTVSVCGEVAGDPLGALALAALEVDSISVAVNQFTAMRQALAGHRPARLAELRPQLLRQTTTSGVRSLLSGWAKG